MKAISILHSLRSSPLQKKVLGIVFICMVIAAGVSITALARLYGSAKELERISGQDFQAQLGIVRTEVALKTQVQEWNAVLIRGRDPAALEAHWQAFLAAEQTVHDFASDARATASHPALAKALSEFLAAHATAGQAYRRAFEAFKSSGFDPVAADKAAEGADRPPAGRLEEAEAIAQEQGARVIRATVAEGREAYQVAIAAIILASIAALVAVGLHVRRSVVLPIASAAGYAERIARGDLTVAIREGAKDEAGALLRALAHMRDGLAHVVSQVRAAAESVASASDQVAEGTSDLSQRTEEQASSLEETAASMEELSGTVRQNADNAREADELALNASKRAEQGGREVARVVATMSEISTSAKRIADIISVIDAIAFQTNILALNAAVEAARAGEQGRGFAVVAAEVRSLAQRSSQAAKEIRDLIGESVSQVDNGTKLVDQAGGTIAALVSDVRKVSGLMASIAEASAEQSRGVQQVNKTVTEMDKVVQQNAAAVQRSANAAENMRREAETLLRAVDAFQLTPESGGSHILPVRAGASPTPIAAPAQAPRAAPAPRPLASPEADEWEEF